MNPGDDWSALSAAWQAQPVDVDALRGAVRRRSRRMQLLMAIDVVFALIAAVFAGTVYLKADGIWPRVGVGIGVVAVVAAVWLNYRLRRGLWHAAGNSVVDLLKLQRQRRVNAVRMAQWGVAFLPLGLLVGALTSPGLKPGLLGWLPAWKIAVLLAVFAGFTFGTWLYVRRQRRLIAAADALLAQYER